MGSVVILEIIILTIKDSIWQLSKLLIKHP